MSVTTGNVLVGQATMYTAPYDPTDGAEPLPADTVGLGEDWAGNWLNPGATDQGLDITVDKKGNDVTIEEQSPPVDVTVSSTDVTVAVTLAEDTLQSMKLAYGGGTIATTAATESDPGIEEYTFSEVYDKLSLGFEGRNAAGFWRRVYVPKVISVSSSVKTSYRRADGKRMYPCTFRALCAVSEIKVRSMTAEATS